MSLVREEYNGYLALLDAVYFDGHLIGYISEDGIEFGGSDAQTFELWAAQIRDAPVDELETRAATLEATGKMIHLIPINCKTLAGGRIEDSKWYAPARSIMRKGNLKFLTGTGGTIEIFTAKLRVTPPRGGLGGENTVGMNFAFKMVIPKDGSEPYAIYPTEAFIKADPTELTFEADGGSKVVNIEASGPFSVGAVPEGFSVEIVNGYVTVVATANSSGSPRSGSLEFILQSDGETKATVTLSQPNS